MFNVGPLELTVLAIVGLIVLGPERLPGLARDAANMLRTLRDLATGAREQLRDELGPEFADLDLRNLNPRTAVQRAVFGDDVDLGRLNPRNALRDAIFGDAEFRESVRQDLRDADPRAAVRDLEDREAAVRMTKSQPASAPTEGLGVTQDELKPVSRANASRPRPRPRPGPPSGYDDAT